MELNLTPILNNPKAAVHCTTQEQAELFIRCVMVRDRTRCGKSMIGSWVNYREETCYSPYFGHPTRDYMTFCPIDHYIKNGFTIIEFEDLAKCVTELDTELGSESIDFLLS